MFPLLMMTNDNPNVLKTTGLGQIKLKENEWPFIQPFELKAEDTITYGRGGKQYTVKI